MKTHERSLKAFKLFVDVEHTGEIDTFEISVDIPDFTTYCFLQRDGSGYPFSFKLGYNMAVSQLFDMAVAKHLWPERMSRKEYKQKVKEAQKDSPSGHAPYL